MGGHDQDHHPQAGADDGVYNSVDHQDHLLHADTDKLRLLASPLAPVSREGHGSTRVESMGAASAHEKRDLEALGFRYRHDHDCPEFVKHSSSTNYELFYDLWFVANLEVFSNLHEITDVPKLTGYIGYVTYVVGLEHRGCISTNTRQVIVVYLVHSWHGQ